jgi:primosomal protein N' (replication factor Y)
VALIHSALGVGERYDEWKRIKSGNADVVIGTRSAVFAPLENIGLIIIDEEQEYTYKSEQNPKYHARDIAKFRAVQHGAMLLLGSATPSIESMYAAKSGKYSIYTLKNRYNGVNLPGVLFADMSVELRGGNVGQISSLLRDEIKKTADSGQQTILFLNRRGSSRYLLCASCGCVPKCPNCSVALTYHSVNNRLMCHYCGHSEKMIEICPQCGSRHVSKQGAGTQKIAEELSELFPGIGIIRMDADTTGGKQTHESLLSRFRDERVPILLGTQMITKGLDFENVTLVGVIDADQSLNVPDFRAGERTFSLITQVVGRAGRGEKTGRAVIQTNSPESEVLLCAASQDYDSFYSGEIEFRESFNYPPYCDILCMELSGAENSKVYAAASHIRDNLAEAKRESDTVYDPAPDPVFKVNNKLRYRVIMKTEDTKPLRNAISLIIRRFMADKRFAGVSLSAVFNPLE